MSSLFRVIPLFIGILISIYTSVAFGVVGSSGTYTAEPPTTSPPTPLVMLTMSNDHQLYYKAYTDWDDLNGDGSPETTYDNSFEYYGYFDPQKCYDYDSTDGRFEPTAVTANFYCDVVSPGSWSGNFLNWATMSRIDILRKVLYGGTRSTDNTTETVLERTYLPTDAHSFAKYYNGSDISQLTPFSVSDITLCNTTYTNDSGSDGESQNVDEPPLIRVVQGDFRYWAANERWQCTYDTERGDNSSGTNTTGSQTTDPHRGTDGLGMSQTTDYIARILACDSTLLGSEECRTYENGGNTYYKPAGLLQEYGEEGQIHFGLLTGSYESNLSGGVVRKNISDFSGEVDANGIFTGVSGIVSTLDAFRISRYGYSDNGRYNVPDNCSWGINSFSEGNCSNWGNPISEMYLEAVRYFAGMSENSNFAAPNDDNYIDGLSTVSWNDPLNADNYCASCNIIVLNASEVSYDNDSLDMTGLPGGSSTMATLLTTAVGTAEGISGNMYFVGENGTNNDQLCTAKLITNLGSVRGTCPGSPRLSGTFNIAGISHWARTQDIRTDLTSNQQITTYSVALSPAVPNIRIPVPSSTREVSILPACRNNSINGNCAIVDFKIIAQDTAAGTGTFYVNWEDSEQGGDYDQDMKGTLSYAINGAGTQITITTDVDAQSTGYRMGFGYIISGTTQDGFHVHSGINNFNYTDPTPGILGCTNCQTGNAATNQIYTIGTSSASLLEDPLFYAAKYGGFTDFDGDNLPDAGEWDNIDLDGNDTPDGIPDNFFPVSNPTQLNASLQTVFNTILNNVASGTAAAVTSNSVNGTGALYQALYQPLLRDGNRSVSWSGILRGIFIDQNGYFREDNHTSGTRGTVDSCNIDRIITIEFDSTVNETLLTRYNCDIDGNPTTAIESISQSELQTVWDVRDNLDAVTNVTNQRSYSANASTGRHIFTFVDSDLDGEVDSGEVVDFSVNELGSTASDANRFRLLNADTTTEADNIINYIRGQDIAGYRSRTIDYDNDGVDEVLRLGDIVHSTPVIVGAPSENYDNLYNDSSYRDYKLAYQDRREVVYVGANDGMLHAFNAGFFNESNFTFETSKSSETAHGLGDEIWAYVPYNLLPHLRWLTEENYPHVYYMDGAPQAFDVKIFTPDSTYVNGWGTILVATMRLGGSPIAIDHDGNSGTPDQTFRSALVVLDVTDPESPPKLLAEITHPDLGLTTSQPAIMYDESGSNSDWYLVFGSGPTDLGTVSSNKTGKIFKFDLNTLSFATNFGPKDLSIANTFISDISTTDWDFDYKTDAVYFGTVEVDTGTSQEFDGRLMRLNGNTATTLLDPGQPFVSDPLLVRNLNEHWIFAGTGRLFTLNDKANSDQQSFYGVKESVSSGIVDYSQTVSRSSLTDVTGISVFLDGTTDDSTYPTWNDLRDHIETTPGWYRDFDNPVTDPSTRNISHALSLFNEFLVFTSVKPEVGSCDAAGESFLSVLHIQTGTAYPFDVIGLGSPNANGSQQALDTIDLGIGIHSAPVIHVGSGGTTIITQSSGSGGSSGASGGGGGASGGGLSGNNANAPSNTGERKSWREIEL